MFARQITSIRKVLLGGLIRNHPPMGKINLPQRVVVMKAGLLLLPLMRSNPNKGVDLKRRLIAAEVVQGHHHLKGHYHHWPPKCKVFQEILTKVHGQVLS